jgi:hypothetical protein
MIPTILFCLMSSLIGGQDNLRPAKLLLENGGYVAIADGTTLYLLDKSEPAWLVFSLDSPPRSFSQSGSRDNRTRDTAFRLDGKLVRYVRFKGVLGSDAAW